MGPTSVMDLAIAERRDLADLLATLTPEQWAAPTLCTEWSVRDVATHLVSYEDYGTLALLRRGAATARRPWRLNELVLAEYDDLGPEEVLARVRLASCTTRTSGEGSGSRARCLRNGCWSRSVLMAMAGRGPAADDLTGPGVDLLRSRAGGR